jgi:nicotinamide-nucleotide amidase
MSPRIHQLVDDILRSAKDRGLTLATAESCSAGRLSAAIVEGKGAAESFRGGLVAYTKDAKTRLLDVPPNLLKSCSAVCAEVAEAMAQGAVKRTGASVAVSITGVAGPEPDEDGNPVGLVFCGAASSDGRVSHRRLDLGAQGPDIIQEEACAAALRLLRDTYLT